MRDVLVTGFEPFGGETTNPSALAAMALDGRIVRGRRIVARVLPCVFGDAIRALEDAIETLDPELVIAVGQAGGREAIGVERVAINVDDARIPDNLGARPIDRPIVAGGPVAYWSTLPIKAIVHALTDAKIPAEVSQTAGTFVCNHVFYALMHALEGTPTRGGFVHVPYLPEQVQRVGRGAPSLPLSEVVRALELVVETALDVEADVRIAGGAEH